MYLRLKPPHCKIHFDLKEKISFNACFKNPFCIQPLEEDEGPHERSDALKEVRVKFLYL